MNALLTLAEKIEEEKFIGEAFNFGPYKNHKIGDVVNEVIKLSKKPYKKINLISKSDDKERRDQFLDKTKAAEKLGWTSKVDLQEGLSETFKWYSDYFTRMKK